MTACGGSDTPTAVSIPTSPPTASSVLRELGLTESHTFPKQLGFSMAYPSGWNVGYGWTGITGIRSTHISELTDDAPDDSRLGKPVAGYQVVYFQNSANRLVRFHNVAPTELSGFLETLRHDFGYEVSAPPEEASAFGTDALRSRGTFGHGLIADCLVGNPGALWYMLCIGAPSKKALDEFIPTWEQMLASVKPVAE